MASISEKESLKQHIEFEYKFYERIAGSKIFEIIPIPTLDGKLLTEDEKLDIIDECKLKNIPLLYRISTGSTAVVFCENTGKIGIVPEDAPHGFMC